MAFFSICPRSKKYLKDNVRDIPLEVVRDGIEVTPDFKVTETDLASGYRNFHVTHGNADKFKISVIIHKNQKVNGSSKVVGTKSKPITSVVHYDEEIEGELVSFDKEIVIGTEIETVYDFNKLNVITILNYYIKMGVPFYINASGIIGINKSNKALWLITENKARKQTHTNYTIWDLTFTRYVPYKLQKFSTRNAGIKSALKQLKQQKLSASAKHRIALRKCKRNVLKYSKKKKIVKCVKTMQQILLDAGCLNSKNQVDGWYGKVTFKAVRKYQNKYRKLYGLKETGHVNLWTYNVMCGKGKKVTKKPKNQIGNTKRLISTRKQVYSTTNNVRRVK